MELEILHNIAKFHNDILDPIMIFVSTINNHGEVWIILSLFLLFFKKTRKCGITMAVALIMMQLVGNGLIKHLVKRPRPFLTDPTIKLIISKPGGYSFPSGHTYSSFSAAFTVFLYNKKYGIIALVGAAFIAFSRLYLNVHYPTDVLAGTVLGIITALTAYLLVGKYYKKNN